MLKFNFILFALFSALILVSSCGKDDDDGGINESETITTLVFSIGDGTGLSATYTWTDPEGDGNPIVDPIELSAGTNYIGIVEFFDRSGSNNESITEEVNAEDEDHLVCYSASGGLTAPVATDIDRNGNPLGLEFNWLTGPNAGTGNLTIRLRHLPDKDALDPCITGDPDIEVSFPVTVF